jgi:hypothetical protein
MTYSIYSKWAVTQALLKQTEKVVERTIVVRNTDFPTVP